jgi:hypothetical protein
MKGRRKIIKTDDTNLFILYNFEFDFSIKLKIINNKGILNPDFMNMFYGIKNYYMYRLLIISEEIPCWRN